MRALSPAEMMMVWERGAAQGPHDRAMTMLSAGWEDDGPAKPADLAQLSIGQRDACLLALRERTFGSQLLSVAACTACGEQVEFTLDTAELRASPPADPAAPLRLDQSGYEVEFRLPNGLDLRSLGEDEGDPLTPRRRLLERCILFVRRDGREVSAAALPPEVAARVVETMADVDPNADLQIALTCPRCAHRWQATLDIVSFLWTEIHARAVRLLREVHLLASAYGWSEAEILALSPARRAAYLEWVHR